MIDPNLVSAVLVTRGDQDLSEIYESIIKAGITDIITWDNSKMALDVGCYGRYLGIQNARHEFIYFQDDDLIAPVADLLAEWRFGVDDHSILANNRIDEEWPLLGIGSLFHRDLAGSLDEYLDEFPFDREFCRTCDVVFGYQHPYRRVVLGYRDLPWGSAPGASMYLEPDHMAVRFKARERALAQAVKV